MAGCRLAGVAAPMFGNENESLGLLSRALVFSSPNSRLGKRVSSVSQPRAFGLTTLLDIPVKRLSAPPLLVDDGSYKPP